MPADYARKLCPDAIFVKPRFDLYREISTEIREVVLEFTEMIEAISVIGGRPLRLNAPIFTTAQD
jgi:DNA polymerase IV